MARCVPSCGGVRSTFHAVQCEAQWPRTHARLMHSGRKASSSKLPSSTSRVALKRSSKHMNSRNATTTSPSEQDLEVPEEVMDSTFRDFTKALESSKALFQALKEKGKRTMFPKLRFKSKKGNSFSIELRAWGFKSSEGLVRFKPKCFGFSSTEGLVKEKVAELQFSVRLQHTCDGRFYLCVPRVKTFAQTSDTRACAIDPGVRSFIMMHDPDGLTLGVDGMKACIFRRCFTIDRLISHRANEPSKRKRYRMGKRLKASFRRVKALVADMYHKVSSWLSTNYTEILLPSFKTQDMTSKQKRISSKTSRAMLVCSHYKFKTLLPYKMGRAGGRMIECEEHYTTKTCSCCGRTNRSITSEKVFSCSHCSLTLDRDVNAARNIYLKNEHLLTRSPGKSGCPETPAPRC